MPDPFPRSTSALRADRSWLSSLGLVVAIFLFGGWIAWLFLARVSVYEVTSTSRLEVEQASHVVQVAVAGRVLRSDLVQGREVCPGDTLVALDPSGQELALNEARTRRDATRLRQDAIDRQAVTLRREMEQATIVVAREAQEARARASQSRAAAQIARVQSERAAAMWARRLISEAEYQSAQSQYDQARFSANAASSEIARLEIEGQRQTSAREAQLQALSRERTDLDAERLTIEAVIARLEFETTLRTVRAPICGRLAEVAVLRPGAYLEEGQRIASILPTGAVRIVALYPPHSAFGRIQRGQHAQMRLTGFPWTEFGSLPAEVTSVGSEVQEGHVRVELAVRPRPRSRIPLQHGMPGTLEIEIERISPVTMLLRAAGQAWKGE